MPKILLVDDEQPIVHSTRLLLQQMGHEVVTTSRAEEILPLLRQERPDILLQDVRMPGLDLGKLLEQIRSEPRMATLPVILFSASLDLEEVARDVGAHGRIEKPFRPVELQTVIAKTLAPAALT